MLSGPGQFAENETNEVNFREITSHVSQLFGLLILENAENSRKYFSFSFSLTLN